MRAKISCDHRIRGAFEARHCGIGLPEGDGKGVEAIRTGRALWADIR
jgi:hypothetical protein